MTRWGMLLLATYVGLALSGLDERRAARVAVGVTAAVLMVVGVRYGAL